MAPHCRWEGQSLIDTHHLLIRRWLFANHSCTHACKTPNVNLVKRTLNLTLTLTLTLTVTLTLNPTLNITFIPHKNNHKWVFVREWLVISHCRLLRCCFNLDRSPKVTLFMAYPVSAYFWPWAKKIKCKTYIIRSNNIVSNNNS